MTCAWRSSAAAWLAPRSVSTSVSRSVAPRAPPPARPTAVCSAACSSRRRACFSASAAYLASAALWTWRTRASWRRSVSFRRSSRRLCSAASSRFSPPRRVSRAIALACSERIVSCALASSVSALRARSRVFAVSRQLLDAAAPRVNLREGRGRRVSGGGRVTEGRGEAGVEARAKARARIERARIRPRHVRGGATNCAESGIATPIAGTSGMREEARRAGGRARARGAGEGGRTPSSRRARPLRRGRVECASGGAAAGALVPFSHSPEGTNAS